MFDDLIQSYIAPGIDIIEGDKSILILCELPNTTKEDIKIVLEDCVLKISGTKGPKDIPEGYRVTTRGIAYGSFARAISLPDHIDCSSVKADYTNGCLTVEIGLTETPIRTIDINIK